jgi:hypothetical protein
MAQAVERGCVRASEIVESELAMLRSLESIERYRVTATDGDIGSVVDFLLDDDLWTVRYLVVDTGAFVGGKRVLISPISFREVDWPSRRVHLALTRDKVLASPSVDLDQPVSRQHELDYCGYYGYGLYWAYPGIWGAGGTPGTLATSTSHAVRTPHDERARADVHLRSINEVDGYHVEGTNGSAGHVAGFIVDDATWEVRYLVIDTRTWWFGKKVLVPPKSAVRVTWATRTFELKMSREEIMNSPAWDERGAILPSFEQRLDRHYGSSAQARDVVRASTPTPATPPSHRAL